MTTIWRFEIPNSVHGVYHLHTLLESIGKNAMPAPAQDFLGAVVSLHPPIKTKPKVRPSPQNGQLPGFQTIQESQPYRIEPPDRLNKEMTHGQSEKRCDEMTIRIMDD